MSNVSMARGWDCRANLYKFIQVSIFCQHRVYLKIGNIDFHANTSSSKRTFEPRIDISVLLSGSLNGCSSVLTEAMTRCQVASSYGFVMRAIEAIASE